MRTAKSALKRIAAAGAPLVEKCISSLAPLTRKNIDLVNAINRQNQMLLVRQYRQIRDRKEPPRHLRDVEFRAYSQNGEDGILLYIFSLIGATNLKCVEMCAGNGIECNTANLVIAHGWEALMFDGDPDNVRQGTAFYHRCKDTFAFPPKFVHAWITAENVNTLITANGFEGQIDLLSLDLDGVDYWICKAIDVVSPRVMVVEYNHLWGHGRAVTVPYRPDFRATFGPYGADYSGASLSAFVKLARERNLRLVGCQAYGTNAFFVRNGLADDLLPEVSPAQCFSHPRARFGMDKRLPNVVGLEWVEV